MAGESGFIKYLSHRFGKFVMIVIVLLLSFWAYKYFVQNQTTSRPSEQPAPSKPAVTTTPISEIKAKMMQNEFIYTNQALCRMECRNISKTDINEILRRGKLSPKISKLNDKPCPTYAFAWSTPTYEMVIAVFAVCEEVTKLVTTYPLGTEDPPSCATCK